MKALAHHRGRTRALSRSLTALIVAIPCTFASRVIVSVSHVSDATKAFGIGNVETVCADISATFKCSNTWASGATGTLVNATNVALDSLRDALHAASKRARPDAGDFTWSANSDAPLSGPGGGERVQHVTSQSDFSDFFIESRLSVLRTSENAAIKLSDPAVLKSQRNAPRHLRQVSGTPLGDPDETFKFNRFSTGVELYVVDGAVMPDHDEFKNLFDGRSRVHPDRFSSATATEKFASDPDCASAHGTHVASLATGYGYGVAKNSTIISVAAQPGCGESGYASDLLAGISFVHERYLSLPLPRPPSIATMSLLLPDGEAASEVERAIADLADAGVIIVAAGGNFNDDSCKYVPARMPQVITVAAMDEGLLSPWSWSNFGECVDVYAPGENILGASPECPKCTAVYSGTSQATPIVTGLVAHILETEPGADVDRVRERLTLASIRFDATLAGTVDRIAQFHE